MYESSQLRLEGTTLLWLPLREINRKNRESDDP